MERVIYPRDEDHVYSERCPNIRIGFVPSVYRDIRSGYPDHVHEPHAIYMRDVANLLWQLPTPYRKLLFHIGAKVVLNKDHRNIASCNYKRRKIRINVEYVAGFKFEDSVITGSARAARHSYTALFEETAHYLVGWSGFYRRKGYKAAMRREIAALTSTQRKIMRLERIYNAVGGDEKGNIEKITPAHQPEELLIDLLRIKNYLVVQGIPKKTINTFMTNVFPHSWPYAKEFDRHVAECARQLTQQRRASPTHDRFRPHGPERQMPRLRQLVKQAIRQAA